MWEFNNNSPAIESRNQVFSCNKGNKQLHTQLRIDWKNQTQALNNDQVRVLLLIFF